MYCMSIFDEEKKMGLCHLNVQNLLEYKKSTNDNKLQFCQNFLSAIPFHLSFFIFKVFIGRGIVIKNLSKFFLKKRPSLPL